jgi:integrase
MNLILGEQLKSESLAINNPERYWVTMLAAYSGARLNEVCQLNISNIQRLMEFWQLTSMLILKIKVLKQRQEIESSQFILN